MRREGASIIRLEGGRWELSGDDMHFVQPSRNLNRGPVQSDARCSTGTHFFLSFERVLSKEREGERHEKMSERHADKVKVTEERPICPQSTDRHTRKAWCIEICRERMFGGVITSKYRTVQLCCHLIAVPTKMLRSIFWLSLKCMYLRYLDMYLDSN